MTDMSNEMIIVDTQDWQELPNEPGWNSCQQKFLLWDEYQIRHGIRLAVQNIGPLEYDVEYEFSVSATAPYEFMCFLAGNTELDLVDAEGKSYAINNRAGKYSLCHLPGASGRSLTRAGKKTQAVGLMVHPDVLNSLRFFSAQKLPGQEIFSCASAGAARSFVREGAIPAGLQPVIAQIIGCNLDGEMKSVFMEFKAMELFYMQLSLLSRGEQSRPHISEYEHKAALSAYTTLMDRLDEPPSLYELARKAGLSHTRLNRVFRALYNDTVFGVLRERRLECARQLLREPGLSVSQIAYDCGFSSPGHFTRMFAKKYGITPKHYQAGK